ncbi:MULTISPECIES: DUF3040 domain-containing protein [unclassified Pseudactinotalea]|uniref:DUF3040 domain-containing protein n=2 Tax=Pseudactinotalea TaxID=1926259 RepID=UPI003C7B7D4A
MLRCTTERRKAHRTKEQSMALWLILIIVGVIMLVIGVAVEAAQILIWIGIIILVASIIMSLVTRGRGRV